MLDPRISDALARRVCQIKAWRQNGDSEYTIADRLFNKHKRLVQNTRNITRVDTDETEGYKEEWEKEDTRKACEKLIEDPKFKELMERPYEKKTPENPPTKGIHYK